MSDRDFWARLCDSTDRTVEPHIVFTGWAVSAIILCGLICAVYNAVEFMKHFAEFGGALGGTIGVGGGVGAIGQGLQSKFTPGAQ